MLLAAVGSTETVDNGYSPDQAVSFPRGEEYLEKKVVICSCLRLGSVAVRLLGLRVRIPLRTWMFVACVCSVLYR
jgi:hypothetical protein